MKKVFTGDESDEEDELLEESQGFYFLPVLLEQTCNSILKFLLQKALTPLITAKRFSFLLQERYGLGPLEKKLVEKHMF